MREVQHRKKVNASGLPCPPHCGASCLVIRLSRLASLDLFLSPHLVSLCSEKCVRMMGVNLLMTKSQSLRMSRRQLLVKFRSVKRYQVLADKSCCNLGQGISKTMPPLRD